MIGGGEYLFLYFEIYEEVGMGILCIDLFNSWRTVYYNSSSDPYEYCLVSYCLVWSCVLRGRGQHGSTVAECLSAELYSW